MTDNLNNINHNMQRASTFIFTFQDKWRQDRTVFMTIMLSGLSPGNSFCSNAVHTFLTQGFNFKPDNFNRTNWALCTTVHEQ